MTVIRILVILTVGIVMYWCLLGALGIAEGGHLRKRKIKYKVSQEKSKVRIIMIYLLTLLAGMIWLFLIIKLGIRGVACGYERK